MTGEERIEAAFSPEGTSEIAAVLPYEGIHYRDHWPLLTSCPWWYASSPSMSHQLQWRSDVIARTPQDWFIAPQGFSQKEREELTIESSSGGVFLLNRHTGERTQLHEPGVSGSTTLASDASRQAGLPRNIEDMEKLLPRAATFDRTAFIDEGRADLAGEVKAGPGRTLCALHHVNSPLWCCSSLGFETMMTLVAERPDLIEYACGRYTQIAVAAVQRAAALGVQVIWIEECFTDMVSPAAYARLALPDLRIIIDEIRANGMKSIHYYCGNPWPKWDMLLDTKADALALEEGKKNFRIDIAEGARTNSRPLHGAGQPRCRRHPSERRRAAPARRSEPAA